MKRYHQRKYSPPGVDVLDVKRASDRAYAVTRACEDLGHYGISYREVFV